MERCPSLPLQAKICSFLNRFFVLTFALTILLVKYCLIITIILFIPSFIQNRGIEVGAHHRTRYIWITKSRKQRFTGTSIVSSVISST